MLGFKNMFANRLAHVKVVIIVSFLILAFTYNIAYGENDDNRYHIKEELRISSLEMNCDYYLEDYKQLAYNFEYPKLVATEEGGPVVAFVDKDSKQLIFAEIFDKGFKVINTIPSFSDYLFGRWPIIFVKKNKIYLGVVKNIKTGEKWHYVIQMYLLDKQNNIASLQKEISLNGEGILYELNSRSGSFLSGIYPYSESQDKFLIVGKFSETHFHPLALFSGHFPTFTKNFSLIWENNEIGKFRIIEEEGWFGAQHRVYDISESGIARSAWIRNTARSGLSTKHNETVCYSENRRGGEWSKPLELYSVKKTDIYNHINNLSLASFGKSAYLLWQDVKSGYYFSEVKDGAIHEMTIIANQKPSPEDLKSIEPLDGASTVKIASDQHGNVYALWVMNSRWRYQMYLKARVNGKWAESMVINSGRGIVKLPDMKVDNKEIIHITYIKQEPEEKFKKFGCYYMKVEKQRQK